jgi:serine acetyltransferase
MKLMDKHIWHCYKTTHKLYINYPNFFKKIVIKIVGKYYQLLLSIFYGAHIPYTAKIGKNINFIHSFHGVFISQYATIGDNCNILHHVTIGSNIKKDTLKKEAPIIGDNVFIGCNVCIIGRTTIGNNSKIGAGVTVVNKDIPKNSIVYVENIIIKKEKIQT